MLLNTDLVTTQEISTLFVAGEVDIAVRDRFAAALEEACERAELTLQVDLADVEFIDSTGMKCLLDAYRRCHRRGVTFRVSRLSRRAERTFEIVGLSDVLCGLEWSDPRTGPGRYSSMAG